jgi:hypothetical protein
MSVLSTSCDAKKCRTSSVSVKKVMSLLVRMVIFCNFATESYSDNFAEVNRMEILFYTWLSVSLPLKEI